VSSFDIGSNNFYQTYTRTVSLSSLGLSGGNTAQLELTRHGAGAGDTLVGDFQLLNVLVSFS
jgi:hypothetical protein